MRRLGALVAMAAAAGCANLGTPPGGPERTTPPVILSVTPESGAVNVRAENAVFQFDVVVSDGGGTGGSLEDLFLVSPDDGRARIRWRRSRIEVRPRRGFRPNTAYNIVLRPGMTDLRGNRMTEGRTLIFSTGPTIPGFAVHGRVFDWMEARVAANARIEVIRKSDSLPFLAISDSSGQFTAGPLDAGDYLVRALIDSDRDRVRDPQELWDSVSVSVRGTSPFLELLAAPRDTIAPRLLTVSGPDSLTLRAQFDRPLDPAQTYTPATFRVVAADSTALRIVAVMTRAQSDSIAAARDSAQRDTSARRDTVGRAALDTALQRAAAATVQPSRPSPPRELVIRFDTLTPLRRGVSYRVTAVGVRGLLGQSRTSDRLITVPVARRDTSRTARPPAAAPTTPPTPPTRPPNL